MSTVNAQYYNFTKHMERYLNVLRVLDAEIQELEEIYAASVARGQEDKDVARQLQERRARVQCYELGVERMLFAREGLATACTVPPMTIPWPEVTSEPQ